MATDMALDSARPIVSCLVGALAAFSYPMSLHAVILRRRCRLSNLGAKSRLRSASRVSSSLPSRCPEHFGFV
jgi:hypothetical protein